MIIDGKEIAKKIKAQAQNCCSTCARKPNVVAFMLGEDPSAESYLRMIEKTCRSVDFGYELIRFETSISEEALLNAIIEKNLDQQVDGILVQMPLPEHISEERDRKSVV